ncbi:hypothetical protein AB0C52_18320 [Streptomyces sp. NPDC048717]|uniref:hypothetical protein n=1 Tax=Streptomyces sp. NPDC048717 TaxID=3154928 RepID=UPI003446C4CB
MNASLRRASGAALTACLAVSLTGCGTGRGYEVPKELCGVGVDQKLLDPFLVDGDKLETTGGSLIAPKGGETWGKCQISVDEKVLLYLNVEKVDKLYDPMAKQDEFRFTNREKMDGLPFKGLGALGDSSAMVSTGCAAPGAAPDADHLVVFVDASVKPAGDAGERRAYIKNYTLDFASKVKKALGCTV